MLTCCFWGGLNLFGRIIRWKPVAGHNKAIRQELLLPLSLHCLVMYR